jgi:hypothetical protein
MNRRQLLSLLILFLLFFSGCDVEVEGDAVGECSDGVDNDQDGSLDCSDEGCAIATACKKGDSSRQPPKLHPFTPATFAFRKLNTIPAAVNAKGPAAWGWEDRNGDNVFVVTYVDQENPSEEEGEDLSTRSRSMLITHDVVGANGKAVRKRTVKDFVTRCPYDVSLQLENDSLQTTDLDGDGFAEITFAYQLTCTSDMSPRGRKLLLLEDGKKYILRGHTGLNGRYALGDDIPSEYKIDPSVANGPKVFRDHMIAAWGGSTPK